jgi:acyl-CoA dehydrogenase
LRVSIPTTLALSAVTNMLTGIYREVPGVRIPGGSEDVMLDLGVRQLVKNFKNKTKAMERPKGSSKL